MSSQTITEAPTTEAPASPWAESERRWAERLAAADQRIQQRREKFRRGAERLLDMPLMTVGGVIGKTRVQVRVPDSFERQGPDAPRVAGRRVMRVQTEEAGDERYSWDSTDFLQIVEARDFFGEMVAKGMVPFRVGPGGKKLPDVMQTFDPTAEEIVFAPLDIPRAVVGG